jgi:hypothetical protein
MSDARGTRTQTTYEEYQVQRYEGASTLYGPHTLGAYLDAFRQLTSALVSGQPIPPGPTPPHPSPRSLPGFLPDVVADTVPWGATFGGLVVDVDVDASGRRREGCLGWGGEVSATFHSANPRNSPRRLLASFLRVERLLDVAHNDNATAAAAVDRLHTDAVARRELAPEAQTWRTVHDDRCDSPAHASPLFRYLIGVANLHMQRARPSPCRYHAPACMILKKTQPEPPPSIAY